MRALVKWSESSFRKTTPRPWMESLHAALRTPWLRPRSQNSGCRSPRGSAPRPRPRMLPPAATMAAGSAAHRVGKQPHRLPAPLGSTVCTPGTALSRRQARALRLHLDAKPPPSTCRPSSATEPISAILPLLNSATRSQTLCTRSSRCEDRSTVTPSCLRSGSCRAFGRRLRVEAGGRFVEDGDPHVLHQDLGKAER